MSKFRIFSFALLTSALIAVAPQCGAQTVDCKLCHKPGGAPGAADFSPMYDNPAPHHRIGMEYPIGKYGFAMPDGMDVDGAFFDRNHNFMADVDEVQMFDAPPYMAVIECATCHMEHGYGTPVPGHPPKYLRFRNTGSSLCTTCHQM